MNALVPPIYAGPPTTPSLSPAWRVFSLALSAGCLTVLLLAAQLTPSPAGVATHASLGLNQCQWLTRMNLPCPSCGMTTSFAWFVRGNLLASLYVQPMGLVLAILACITFWAALYVAFTGKPIARLLRMIPTHYYLVPLMTLAVAAWGWKIWIHLRGIDGWR